MEIQKVFAYTFPLKKYAHTLVHSDVGYVIGEAWFQCSFVDH